MDGVPQAHGRRTRRGRGAGPGGGLRQGYAGPVRRRGLELRRRLRGRRQEEAGGGDAGLGGQRGGGDERPPPGERVRLQREFAAGRVGPELRIAYGLYASGVMITYEDYLYHIDAMTLSDLMMMREIEAQKQSGDGAPSSGLALEAI